jgi:thiol-disulfide isomerase/thioredoxin
MVTRELLKAKFEAGKAYGDYVAGGSPGQTETWLRAAERVRLTPAQAELVASFEREVNVVVSSGLWCGDCVQQCPILARIGEANPGKVRVRFVDRDEHIDLSEMIRISEGLRVPTAVFCNEDFDFVDLVGDGTLSRYRAKAEKALGAACPLPGAEVPEDELAATVQDWVDLFERVHLINRLSPKLRQRHGD